MPRVCASALARVEMCVADFSDALPQQGRTCYKIQHDCAQNPALSRDEHIAVGEVYKTITNSLRRNMTERMFISFMEGFTNRSTRRSDASIHVADARCDVLNKLGIILPTNRYSSQGGLLTRGNYSHLTHSSHRSLSEATVPTSVFFQRVFTLFDTTGDNLFCSKIGYSFREGFYIPY